MTRVPGWEDRLNSVVAKHQALPSQYGVSDCYLIADDGVEAVTGAQMYADVRTYTTPAGAAKLLRKRNFKNVRAAFAAKFAEIGVLSAQRGDIGVVERDGVVSGGLFTAIGFMTRGEGSVEFLPLSQVTAAFRVE